MTSSKFTEKPKKDKKEDKEEKNEGEKVWKKKRLGLKLGNIHDLVKQKQEKEKQGITIKEGVYTPDELNVLDATIISYKKENNLDDESFYQVLYGDRQDRRGVSGWEELWPTIISSLPSRLPGSIYDKVKSRYHPGSGIEWTREEDEKLLNYYAVYGSDWLSIGSLVGRWRNSVRDRIRAILKRGSVTQRQPWTEEKTKKLLELIDQSDPQHTGKDLPWPYYAMKLHSTSIMCRWKYCHFLKRTKSIKLPDNVRCLKSEFKEWVERIIYAMTLFPTNISVDQMNWERIKVLTGFSGSKESIQEKAMRAVQKHPIFYKMPFSEITRKYTWSEIGNILLASRNSESQYRINQMIQGVRTIENNFESRKVKSTESLSQKQLTNMKTNQQTVPPCYDIIFDSDEELDSSEGEDDIMFDYELNSPDEMNKDYNTKDEKVKMKNEKEVPAIKEKIQPKLTPEQALLWPAALEKRGTTKATVLNIPVRAEVPKMKNIPMIISSSALVTTSSLQSQPTSITQTDELLKNTTESSTLSHHQQKKSKRLFADDSEHLQEKSSETHNVETPSKKKRRRLSQRDESSLMEDINEIIELR